MVVACNTTGKSPLRSSYYNRSRFQLRRIIVYDATYSTAGGVVQSLIAQESNATVASIPILGSQGALAGASGRFVYELLRVVNLPVSLDL
jgi:hypothetical protein